MFEVQRHIVEIRSSHSWEKNCPFCRYCKRSNRKKSCSKLTFCRISLPLWGFCVWPNVFKHLQTVHCKCLHGVTGRYRKLQGATGKLQFVMGNNCKYKRKTPYYFLRNKEVPIRITYLQVTEYQAIPVNLVRKMFVVQYISNCKFKLAHSSIYKIYTNKYKRISRNDTLPLLEIFFVLTDYKLKWCLESAPLFMN